MYPVIAEWAIMIAETERRQGLAAAERVRLIQDRGIAADAPNAGRRSLVRAWTGLGGVVRSLTRGDGARPVEIGGERAAVRS